jgi:hypothetical protein
MLFRRIVVSVAAIVAGGPLLAPVVPVDAAPTSPRASCVQGTGPYAQYRCAREGDLLDVRIGDVHPTQPSLGYDEVYYKLGRYTLGKDSLNKKFSDWCEADGRIDAVAAQAGARLDDPSSFTCRIVRGQETPDSMAPMKTVVIGPGGEPFLTDGHHTLTAFAETPDGGLNLHVRLRVLANFSRLSSNAFWSAMEDHQWVWLQEPSGSTIDAGDLPTSIGLANFADDGYRSLLYFGRDIGYAQNNIPFQEFYWGVWLRDSNPDLAWDANDLASYLAAVDTFTHAQVALPPAATVAGGFTAADLDALATWNTSEFAKLSKPYSDPKPGKLAYALEYKLGLP